MNEILENKNLKEFPFNVSSGYFSSLEERVRAKMEAEGEGKKVAVWRTLRASLALAGAFILIMALGGLVLKYSTEIFQNNSDPVAEELANVNIEDSVQTLFLAEQLEGAILEGENAEVVYSQIISGSEDLSQIDNLDEVLDEYLDNLPTGYYSLLAEDLR